LLQALIVFGRERSGQVLGALREILAQDQPGWDGLALGCEIVEQTTESVQVFRAGDIGQEWGFLAEAAKPAEQVRVAAQLGELAHLREVRLEIGEEVTRGASIADYGAGFQGGRESLNKVLKHLPEYGVRQGRWRAPVLGGARFSRAWRPWREILGKDQPRLQGMSFRDKILE